MYTARYILTSVFVLLACGKENTMVYGKLRGKKGSPPPPPVELSGGSTNDTTCGVAPPSLLGGCDTACIFEKGLEAGAQAVISAIPYVGDFLSNLVGAFWPQGTDEAIEELNETIQYIDAKIAAAESQVLMEIITGDYHRLLKNIANLNTKIASNDSSDERMSLLVDILDTDCEGLRSQFESDTSTDPIPRLAAIGIVGQACIAMRVAKVYHFNSTVGGTPPNNATMAQYKQDLDDAVQKYIDLAGKATQEALAWRMNQIQFQNVQGGYCCYNGWCFDHTNTATIQDSACYAVGGPSPNSSGVIGYGEQCHQAFVDPTGFVQLYQMIASESFTDNVLSVSRSLIPLWRLQTSENIEAGRQPIPVIRAATSVLDNFLRLNITNAWAGYTAPTSEMQAIYDYYNGATSQGQLGDRITEIMVAQVIEEGYNSVGGIVVTQELNGESRTLQIGQTSMDDTQFQYYTLQLEANERIVAVGTFDCNDPNFIEDGGCESLGAAFKTVFVDENGAFQSEGQVWNPLNYPESASWIEAPPLAQRNNSTFVPFVISFDGWATSNWLSAKVPVWLYESLE